jgi:hypothetical protein
MKKQMSEKGLSFAKGGNTQPKKYSLKRADTIFILLGITDLPNVQYGVTEQWLDNKLKRLNCEVNNKTRNKLLSELQARFDSDWENGLLGISYDKTRVVWLEWDEDRQQGLEEMDDDGRWVAKKDSKTKPFTNKDWDYYFESIVDDEDIKFAKGGKMAKGGSTESCWCYEIGGF